MKVTRFISKDTILLNLACDSKEELLKKMVDTLVTKDFLVSNKDLTKEIVLENVYERESQRSTAMGGEIAFPHARIEGLKTPALAIAVLKKALQYDETNSVRIVCMMLAPLEQQTLSLKVMAALARFFIKPDAVKDFLELKEKESILAKLEAENLSVDVPICARDIMRPPCLSVSEKTPLREIAKILFTNQIDTIPVVDEHHKIIGDITTNRLLRFGLPDFFTKLKSVSFIAEFDPFEKYFEAESKAVAADVMADAHVVNFDHTILEIVFDLAVKKHPKLYVQDEKQRWIGVIDRSIVLDNVINF